MRDFLRSLPEWFRGSVSLKTHVSRWYVCVSTATDIFTFVWSDRTDYHRAQGKTYFCTGNMRTEDSCIHIVHIDYFRRVSQCNLKYLKWGAWDLCIILTKMGASRRWSEHLFWIHKARVNVSSVFRLCMSLIWVYTQIQIQFSYSFHATSSYIWTLLFWSAAGADTQYVLAGCYIFSCIGEMWAIYLFCMSVICSLHSTVLSACH